MPKRDKIIVVFVVLNVLFLLSLKMGWLRRSNEAANAQTQAEQPHILLISSQVVLGPHPNFRGQLTSPFALVEFGDYQCPPCARAHTETQKVLRQHVGKLKFAFRHYPLDGMHPYALPAALAAEDAQQQGKFWQMHDALYDCKGEINSDAIHAAARAVGIKTILLPSVIKTNTAAITRDRNDGDKAGVEGTPTFILCCPDGKVIRLATLSQVEQYVK